MPIKAASNKQLNEFIQQNHALSLKQNKLHQEFIFKNFVEAFGFMTQVSSLAETLNHHPEWFNVYNKVIVDLATHEVNAITERDLNLAKQMDAIAAVYFQ